MSTQALQSLHSRLRDSSPPHTELCVHASMDRTHFQTFPSSTFLLSTGTFSNVLPELRPMLAIQASSPEILVAINSAEWPKDEVDLDYGYSVRIVDNAAQLVMAFDCHQPAAFVRTDGSLVLWGDYEGAILSQWSEIMRLVQNRFGGEISYSNQLLSLSGDVIVDPFWWNLPPLDELSLATIPAPAASLYPTMSSTASTSPDMGGLQLAFDVLRTSSPSGSSGFGDTPITDNSANISLGPAHLVELAEGEVLASSISPEFLTTQGDGESNAPSERAIGRKTKRALSEDNEYVPTIDELFDDDDDDDKPRETSGVRASKRRRSLITTSAPALLSVPLPTLEHAHNNNNNDTVISFVNEYTSNTSNNNNSHLPTLPPAALRSLAPAPAPAPAPATATVTAPTSAPSTPVPFSSFSSQSQSPSSSSSYTVPRRARRRVGGATRGRRTQCEHCGKSFSRAQDAQRHASASCPASPEKEGVQCPECGQVLSRIDSAQRHWRGHVNPTCETPEWAHRV